VLGIGPSLTDAFTEGYVGFFTPSWEKPPGCVRVAAVAPVFVYSCQSCEGLVFEILSCHAVASYCAFVSLCLPYLLSCLPKTNYPYLKHHPLCSFTFFTRYLYFLNSISTVMGLCLEALLFGNTLILLQSYSQATVMFRNKMNMIYHEMAYYDVPNGERPPSHPKTCCSLC
jgi:hypothetical protein